MKQVHAIIASLALVTLAGQAFADSTKDTKTSGTDSNGTYTSDEQNVKVKNHKDGTITTTTKTESVNDPKGLMNKTTDKSKETVKTDANGNVLKDKKTVNGKVVVDEKAASGTATK